MARRSALLYIGAMQQPSAPRPAPFRKMHGLGNDFVVIDARTPDAPRVTPALARALGDRRFGVGFDQLVTIEPAARPGVDAHVTFWNPDGGTAAACGNATRCVAALVMAETGRDVALLESDFGPLPAERLAGGRIRVDMGAPRLGWRDIPLSLAMDTVALDLEIEPGLAAPGAVSMGNPHCVFFTPDAEAAPLTRVGAVVERHALFPERTNVEFVSRLGPGRLRLRVWERGAGVTLACGSGACATLVAAVRRGLADRRETIVMDGGALEIEWREADDHVLMTGPYAHVFDGVIAPDLLASVDAA